MPSPPPFYNFAIIPSVETRDPYFAMKKQGGLPKPQYEDIHMPKNTGQGVYIAVFAFLAGFAFVWHIVWLIVVGLAGIVICSIVKGFQEDSEYTLPAAAVAKIESQRAAQAKAQAQSAVADGEEMGLWDFLGFAFDYVRYAIRKKRWRMR